MTQGFEMLNGTSNDFEFPSDELLADELFDNESEAEMDELFEQEAEFDEFSMDELSMDEAPSRRPRRRPPPPAALAAAIERQRSRAQGFERAVRGLAPRVRRQGNRVQLAIPQAAIPDLARRLGIQPRGVEILVRSAAARARPAGIAGELDLETGAGCQGTTRYSLHWWGHRLQLNSCHTEQVLDAAEAGSAVATICAAIPALKNQVVCGVIAGALVLGRLVVRRIHERGGKRGIVIRKPLMGPPVLWHP